MAAREAQRLEVCPRPDKRAYGSRDAATRVMQDMRQAGKVGLRGTLAVYRCACGSYHVGSKAKTLDWRIHTVTQRPNKPRRAR